MGGDAFLGETILASRECARRYTVARRGSLQQHVSRIRVITDASLSQGVPSRNTQVARAQRTSPRRAPDERAPDGFGLGPGHEQLRHSAAAASAIAALLVAQIHWVCSLLAPCARRASASSVLRVVHDRALTCPRSTRSRLSRDGARAKDRGVAPRRTRHHRRRIVLPSSCPVLIRLRARGYAGLHPRGSRAPADVRSETREVRRSSSSRSTSRPSAADVAKRSMRSHHTTASRFTTSLSGSYASVATREIRPAGPRRARQ